MYQLDLATSHRKIKDCIYVKIYFETDHTSIKLGLILRLHKPTITQLTLLFSNYDITTNCSRNEISRKSNYGMSTSWVKIPVKFSQIVTLKIDLKNQAWNGIFIKNKWSYIHLYSKPIPILIFLSNEYCTNLLKIKFLFIEMRQTIYNITYRFSLTYSYSKCMFGGYNGKLWLRNYYISCRRECGDRVYDKLFVWNI